MLMEKDTRIQDARMLAGKRSPYLQTVMRFLRSTATFLFDAFFDVSPIAIAVDTQEDSIRWSLSASRREPPTPPFGPKHTNTHTHTSLSYSTHSTFPYTAQCRLWCRCYYNNSSTFHYTALPPKKHVYTQKKLCDVCYINIILTISIYDVYKWLFFLPEVLYTFFLLTLYCPCMLCFPLPNTNLGLKKKKITYLNALYIYIFFRYISGWYKTLSRLNPARELNKPWI